MTATIEASETMTAREIAKAIKVGTRTRKFVLRDEDGYAYEGRRYELVLSALSRFDRSDLTTRIHVVAYALLKSMSSCRMNSSSLSRIADYSPYQLCRLVARIAAECPETTIGGICDEWLSENHASL